MHSEFTDYNNITMLQATGIRLAILVQSCVGLIAALVIAFIFGWKLALVILGCVPVLVIAGQYFLWSV